MKNKESKKEKRENIWIRKEWKDMNEENEWRIKILAKSEKNKYGKIEWDRARLSWKTVQRYNEK